MAKRYAGLLITGVTFNSPIQRRRSCVQSDRVAATRTATSGVPTHTLLVLRTERHALMTRKAIQQDTLEALVSDAALREARAVRIEGGWSLEGRIGVSWRPVRSRREPVRVWRSLTALERFCTSIGLRQLLIEL